eukprot:2235103-Amphidinium_carterae.1
MKESDTVAANTRVTLEDFRRSRGRPSSVSPLQQWPRSRSALHVTALELCPFYKLQLNTADSTLRWACTTASGAPP